ncbi:2 beta-glucan [Dentipellis sp. KUC8613]|nr:2 beta-glucan [Dentipellis sp. KUC8613]
MQLSVASVLLSTLFAARTAHGGTYSLSDTIDAGSFLDNFAFQAIADPTHGHVNYVDLQTAQNEGIITLGSTIKLSADVSGTVPSSAGGRDSFRVQSNKQYTTHIAIFNVNHMPHGCGTWPAIWELGDNWPNGGEVDIVEGVNDVPPNRMTLHTSAGCTMPASRDESGTPLQNDCNVAVNSNAGCGVLENDPNSYGPDFNSNGGGWWAMERTSDEVKIWFWTRDDANTPSDIKNGASSLNTDNWGRPDAYFPNTDCDFSSHFSPHNIIINLTFCGDWAGSAYSSSGCPSTCEDYVDNNPAGLINAFFEFEWIKIYE